MATWGDVERAATVMSVWLRNPLDHHLGIVMAPGSRMSVHRATRQHPACDKPEIGSPLNVLRCSGRYWYEGWTA